jgi:hypothetical protein
MAKHVVSTTLVVLYALLGAWVAAQLLVLFRAKGKRTGYKAVFNYLTLLWCAMRSTFWLTFALEVQLPQLLFYLWFWLPQSVQFLTFSLLALFLMKLLTREQWRDGGWKTRSIAVLGVVALAHVVGSVLLASLASEDSARSGLYENVQTLGSACVFILLSCVLAVLAQRLSLAASWETSRLMLFGFTPRALAGITGAIAAIFVSRSAFDFLTYAGIVSIDIQEDNVSTDLSAAVVYALWEFFPVILLLATLAAGPRGSGFSGSGGAGGGGAASLGSGLLPTFGAFGALGTLAGDHGESLLSGQTPGLLAMEAGGGSASTGALDSAAALPQSSRQWDAQRSESSSYFGRQDVGGGGFVGLGSRGLGASGGLLTSASRGLGGPRGQTPVLGGRAGLSIFGTPSFRPQAGGSFLEVPPVFEGGEEGADSPVSMGMGMGGLRGQGFFTPPQRPGR